ncbi:MAG: PEGA domain-containing protein [Gammaproteobacteria bacterium]|nr:PEGA domain-containing protein [Gammaproteobacteria bacterium]
MTTERQNSRRTVPAASSDVIEPTAFEPPGAGRRAHPRSVRWGTVAGVVLLAAAALVVWFLVSAKSVELVVSPEGTSVAVAGWPVFKVGDRYLVRAGHYRVSLSQRGYRSQEEDIEVGSASQQRFEFALEKLPGHLAVSSTPVDGARVWIDDDERGTTPVTVNDIAPGEHQLRVEAARYRAHSEPITVQGLDRTQRLAIELEPAWVNVTVDSEPGGAAVTVDRIQVGVTPLRTEILEGEHTIEVSLAGHESWRRSFTVVAGQDLEMPTVALRAADGRVAVKTKPAGVAVTVDGVYRGVTPLDLALTPRRSHRLELHKDGYVSAERALRVDSGQRQSLTVELVPKLGVVSFRIEPADAELFIDGRKVDAARHKVELTVRDHRIRVVKPGYADFNTTVRPRPGVDQLVTVALKTSAQAKWESVKSTITSPGGQTLKLFRPEAQFTMGASRREQGRRSNEVLRKVHVRRAFYLSVKEVTNAEFRRFAPEHSSSNFKGESLNGDRHPVVNVDWEKAARYCNWLSEQASLPPFYRVSEGRISGFDPNSNGFRMPTEAEWAWAARMYAGGLRKYPWGANFPPMTVAGNYADRSAAAVTSPVLSDYVDNYPASAPVGSFAADKKGLYDLGGNVAEWVHDYYSIVPNASGPELVNPLGPETGEYHVIRGSSWAHGGISELRLSYRDYGRERRRDVGFRVARWVE